MTGFWDGSGIRRTICKQDAPSSEQITTPTPHQSILWIRYSTWGPNKRQSNKSSNTVVQHSQKYLYYVGVGDLKAL